MPPLKQADLLALDITTSELGLAVRDGEGKEDFASVKMRGGTRWRNDPRFPAFDLDEVPGMVGELLATLEAIGWEFRAAGEQGRGHLSVACRQHDLVLLDDDGSPLTPAISWQCHAATKQVAELRAAGVEEEVGTIEPRFVLPKLKCVLEEEPGLRDQVATVLMTGDWVAYALTGQKSLSTSDALSNGLLEQESRRLAERAIAAAGFQRDWFPNVVQSGAAVAPVDPARGPSQDAWAPIREKLAGWQFVAGLGDNHASAAGCGMKDDYRTLVVSAGTSGTINLSCPKDAPLPRDGAALKFEFYDQSLLLLLMLGDCGAWYNRFVEDLSPENRRDLDHLNALAASSDLSALRRVVHDDEQHSEQHPDSWPDMPLGEKAASTQFSIMLELLLRTKAMLAEVRGVPAVDVQTFVLTGGLSRSPLAQHVFYQGIRQIAPGKSVKVSGRTGPLKYKTSAYGALINAELLRVNGNLDAILSNTDRFPLIDCARPDQAQAAQLDGHLRVWGLKETRI